MTGIWLGQAGFSFQLSDGTAVMVDPYLSNALEEAHGAAFCRQVPLSPVWLKASTDVLILTHSHDDHMDLTTLDHLLGEASHSIFVFSPRSVWEILRERYGQKHQYILLSPGTEFTLGNLRLCATPAFHSDPFSIGVWLQADGKGVWHMGDTLYHRDLTVWAQQQADLLILPINGKGNNMNGMDAARLTCKLAPKGVLPMHWDMFAPYGCHREEFCRAIKGQPQIRLLCPQHYESFLI